MAKSSVDLRIHLLRFADVAAGVCASALLNFYPIASEEHNRFQFELCWTRSASFVGAGVPTNRSHVGDSDILQLASDSASLLLERLFESRRLVRPSRPRREFPKRLEFRISVDNITYFVEYNYWIFDF
jgi:hypothetical protein